LPCAVRCLEQIGTKSGACQKHGMAPKLHLFRS
jgi:hypothetical protein